MKDLTLYIPTCDSYLFLVKPYTFLFNKFWNRPQKVVYLGYDKPKCDLPDNFDFITIGNDDDLKNWSSDLINFFNSIDDEHFMVCTDDLFLVDYTNFEVYDKLLKYLDNPKVGRINVSRDTVNRPHKDFDTSEGLTIIEAKQSADYRISLSLSIWRRDYFLKNLKPNKKTLEKSMTKELYATEKVLNLTKKGIPFRDAYKKITKSFVNQLNNA